MTYKILSTRNISIDYFNLWLSIEETELWRVLSLEYSLIVSELSGLVMRRDRVSN